LQPRQQQRQQRRHAADARERVYLGIMLVAVLVFVCPEVINDPPPALLSKSRGENGRRTDRAIV
jgi:hypothetical protein